MTEAQAYEAIRQRWETEWAASAYASIPYGFDNESFQAPGDGTAYIRATVLDGDSRAACLGGTKHRRDGKILIFAHVPADQGRTYATNVRTAIRDIFESRRFGGGVNCGSTPSSSGARGFQSNARYWIASVEIPFWFIENRSA